MFNLRHFCRNSPGHTGIPVSDMSHEAHRHLLWPLTPFLHLSKDWSWQLKSCQICLCEVKRALDYKSTVASSTSVDRLMRLVGGQDNSNSQQQLIPSCHNNRACHKDKQLTHRRRVRRGERSKVTGSKDKHWHASSTNFIYHVCGNLSYSGNI